MCSLLNITTYFLCPFISFCLALKKYLSSQRYWRPWPWFVPSFYSLFSPDWQKRSPDRQFSGALNEKTILIFWKFSFICFVVRHSSECLTLFSSGFKNCSKILLCSVAIDMGSFQALFVVHVGNQLRGVYTRIERWKVVMKLHLTRILGIRRRKKLLILRSLIISEEEHYGLRQTDTTFPFNTAQRCWIQHVERDWPPSWIRLIQHCHSPLLKIVEFKMLNTFGQPFFLDFWMMLI